ncbi:hypothetical protein LTR37_002075 [Vermiconidia calcicola]|uniref:Uncharacterized protein n=1 Tax=Vermiconidia calcicola TaxID=1690605 RepID=A0ACC3NUZ0_9PEZI|nr:hypothetical protein LTR37_002075 [Vermiconidia calcicola]
MDRADNVPVATTLSLSARTCSRKGDPPFAVTIKHHSTATQPIWALVYSFPDWCRGIEIRDLELHRRRGPSPLWAAYTQYDEDPDPRDDASLERLAPGQSLEIAYTFCVERKLNGYFRSDVDKLKNKKRYTVTLRKQKWWWMFEDEMPTDCTTDDERRRFLGKQECCEWKPECVREFEMVE